MIDISGGIVLSAIAEKMPALKRRRPWLASFLSLLLSGLGQLYNGDPRRGGILFATELVVTLAAVLLLKPMTSFIGMALCFAILIAWKVFVIADAWRGAQVVGKIALRRYNRWWAYLGIILLGSLLFTPARLINEQETQSFSIESGSDLPNLRPGERIMAIGKPPIAVTRGDIVVFLHPKSRASWIRRVIALPGERVAIENSIVSINGVTLSRETLQGGEVLERLPEGLVIRLLDGSRLPLFDQMATKTVPPGHYFVLGDNRDNSLDSRMPDIGMVPAESIIRKAAYIYWSDDLSRIGQRIE